MYNVVITIVATRLILFNYDYQLIIIILLLAEINLVDYLETDIYTSDHIISQQLLSIETSPESLTQSYLSCNPNPNLHQFTPLFDDGRNAMCLYSYPEFFFMSWRQSIEKEAKRNKVLELTVS